MYCAVAADDASANVRMAPADNGENFMTSSLQAKLQPCSSCPHSIIRAPAFGDRITLESTIALLAQRYRHTMYGRAAQERDTQHALDRRNDPRQCRVDGDERLGLD